MSSKQEGLAFRLSSKRLPREWTQNANRFLDRLFGFDRFNAVFHDAPEGADPKMVLDAMAMRVQLSGSPLEAIPESGALVLVCNHPFGVIDGMIALSLLRPVRSDGVVLVAHWLASAPRFDEHVIVVGARGVGRRRRQSVRGWLTAVQRLKRGGAIAVFPAGQAACFSWRRFSIADAPWSPHVASAIRKTSAQVVPVFFAGGNSRLFYALTAVLPGLANVLLVREFLKKKNATVRVVVGPPIAAAELQGFGTDQEATDFLRAKVEGLGRPCRA